MTPGKSPTKFDVAVIGLGFVGLPLVVEACRSGLRVLGLDVDSSKVQHLFARGELYRGHRRHRTRNHPQY